MPRPASVVVSATGNIDEQTIRLLDYQKGRILKRFRILFVEGDLAMPPMLRLGRVAMVALIGAWLGTAGGSRAESPEGVRLVRLALRAEIDGQPPLRAERLKQAVSQAPDYAPAHRHRGEVYVGGEWVPVATAEQQAAQNTTLAADARLRDGSPDSAAGHISLAAFCRKNSLTDREKWHWANVLRFQPENSDAIRALGLKKYRNTWLTQEEIEQCQADERRYEAAKARWQPVLKRISQSLKDGGPDERQTALADLQAIDDPAAVPFLESELADADETAQAAAVETAGKIKAEAATLALVRRAVFASSEVVRDAAADQLKRRPIFSYAVVIG